MQGLSTWVEAKSNITTDEIELVEETLSTPLAHFSEFEDHVANTNMNYTFLTKHNYVLPLPPLMRIKLFMQSLSRFDQFTTYISTYKDDTPMSARTYEGLSAFLIKHYPNMPKESATRGGHAFQTKKDKKKAEEAAKASIKARENETGTMTTPVDNTVVLTIVSLKYTVPV
jgi:hypothetical protein